jgi:hypothetical protein
MENICIKFFKGGHMTEEEEEIVVDYLSDHRIKIHLDTSNQKMCQLALTHKYGSKEKFNDVILNLNKETEVQSEKFIKDRYGNLDINTYLKIAMESDDKTLLNMMNVSKIHSLKFDDSFFGYAFLNSYFYIFLDQEKYKSKNLEKHLKSI